MIVIPGNPGLEPGGDPESRSYWIPASAGMTAAKTPAIDWAMILDKKKQGFSSFSRQISATVGKR